MYPINDNIALTDEVSSVTYREVYTIKEQITAQLDDLTVVKGDRIGICMHGGIPISIMFMAVSSKFSAVVMNFELTDHEYREQLPLANIRALIVEVGSNHNIIKIANELGIVVIENDSYSLTTHNTLRPIDKAAETDEHYASFSSGTVGNKTIIPTTRAFTFSQAILFAHKDLHQSMTQHDKTILLLSLHTAYALENLCIAAIYGQNLFVPREANRKNFSKWAAKHKPTYLAAGPYNFNDIINRSTIDSLENSSLRNVQVGGALYTSKLRERVEHWFGCPSFSIYGMNEIGLISSNHVGSKYPEAAGKIVDNVIVKISNDGEILVKSDVGTNGDWYHTEDLGEITDGYLFITGRVREMIDHGGTKILPLEIEQAARMHKDIKECCVFAIDGGAMYEEVAMIVVSSLSESEILLHLSTLLNKHKLPSQIKIVENIVKSEHGKISRKENKLAYEHLFLA